MKIFLLILLLLSLLLPQASWAQVALVGTGVSVGDPGGGTTVTTATYNTTGANLIVCGLLSWQTNAEATITDSNTNTWTTTLTPQSSTANVRAHLIYAINPTVGAGHTFTATFTLGSFVSLGCLAFSGAHITSPADVENGAKSDVNVTSLATGSVTAATGAVAVTVLGNGITANTASINSSFTKQLTTTGTANHYNFTMAYLLNAATVNPTWSWGTTVHCATAIASFLQIASVNAPQSGQGPLNVILGK